MKKGFIHSEKTRNKMSKSHTGKTSGMLGKKHSEETKRKISISGKKAGNGKWTKNRKHSQETRKKMSLSHGGTGIPQRPTKRYCTLSFSPLEILKYLIKRRLVINRVRRNIVVK